MTNENTPLRILVLHRLGDPQKAPHFLSRLVYFLRNSSPNHHYLYHDVSLPLPKYVKETFFDAVILDVTFLAMRSGAQSVLKRIKEEYSFLQNVDAIKIALPQDEYDCHRILDDWLCEWNVDVVYSVIDSHWPVLFPRYHQRGEIRLGYTGYIDESLLDRPIKKWEDRPIDIGYRARRLMPYFGRIGEIKGSIGVLVEEKAKLYNLVTDINVADSKTILGEKWLDFLIDSKFTLGTNSGSSLLDPTGEIQRAVRRYLGSHPKATFEEVEAQCFYGLDGQYAMTAISPRIFEAALMGSCQILVRGSYSGIIVEGEHYIPIKDDASDFDDVYRRMKDRVHVDQMVKMCRSAILDVKALRTKYAADQILELIRARTRAVDTNQERINWKAIISRYEKEMRWKYKRLWRLQLARSALILQLKKSPRFYRGILGIRERLRSAIS